MESFLTDTFRSTIEKEKLGEENLFTPNYGTGIDIVNYRNGRIEGDQMIVGVDGGKILTIVGRSGTGKSTLAIQTAVAIANSDPNAQIIHFDFERATNMARVEGLSGWDQDTIKNKYILLNRNIYSESVYKVCKSVNDIKISNFDRLKVDSGKLDYNGKKIYVLPPTVVLIDSWAVMIPKDIADEKELSGSMTASAIAKSNNAIAKRLIGVLETGNITLIIVNHITQKIEIGLAKTQASLNYMKQDESIPGGTSCIYLANTLLKLTASSKLEDEKEFGVKGFLSFGEFLKSRSNEAGRRFTMVFSQSDGYDNLLTNYVIVKEAGFIKGGGRGFYLESCPDIKFTQKMFKEKYNKEPELKKAFDAVVSELFKSYIPNSSDIESDNDEVTLVKCVDKNNDVWIGSDGKYYLSSGDEVEYIEE